MTHAQIRFAKVELIRDSLIFHSLFKHHPTPYQKAKIDGTSHLLAQAIMEHDGYLSWFLLAGPHTITAWNNPLFLNATIFSDLRYLTKKKLVQNRSGGKFSFSAIGTYLYLREDASG